MARYPRELEKIWTPLPRPPSPALPLPRPAQQYIFLFSNKKVLVSKPCQASLTSVDQQGIAETIHLNRAVCRCCYESKFAFQLDHTSANMYTCSHV